MATVRDIDDIVTKLTSDKAKTREEGIKVLNSYLDGGSCRSFCLLLDQHSVKLRPQEIPRSASWPFLLGVLYKCIATEVSLSKKRGPKLILAKTIRNFVQHAEDVKRSGKTLLLLRAIKGFFNHIWEIIRDVPSFQSEYSNMLRQLLAVSEYRMQMRKKVYSGLVLFYLDKVKTVVCNSSAEHSVSKEELFRYTLTLHSLLENSPGDFPVDLRGALIQGFIEIFSHLRDEGKIARKLLGSLNSFLVKDGPNIGLCAHEIHAAAQNFMVCCWLTTHDRSLKDGLILYARIQLKLRGILSDGGAAIEQLLDLVVKELDQNITAPASFRKHDGWNYDGARDEKLGTITRSQRSLMELAATVLYEACVKVDQGLSAPKRQKKENMDSIVRDRLIKARWLWHGAFCLLIRNHSADLPKPIILDWFRSISLNLERILSDGVNDHVYDGPLWTLRSLQELCITWPFIFPRVKSCHQSSIITIEAKDCWQMIWNSLIHWLPSFSNMGIMIDATFKLLGHLISQNLLPIYSVPRDFWDFRLFCEEPSGSLLYFTASFFSCASCQVTHGDVLHLRRKLLKWISKVLNSLDQLGTSKELAVMFFSAIFSVCVGCVPSFPFSELDPVKLVKMHISRKMEDWAELDEEEKSQEDQFLVLDHSEQILAASGVHNSIQMCEETNGMISSSILLPESLRDPLLNEMESCLLGKLSSDISEKQISLTSLINICTVISALMYGSFHMNFHRYKRVCDSSQKTMLGILSKAMDKCINMIEAYVHALEEGRDSTTSFSSGPFSAITPSTLIAVQKFMSYLPSCKLESVDGVSIAERLSGSVIPFLERLLLSLSKLFDVASGVLQTKELFHNSGEGLDNGTNDELGSISLREGSDRARIVDEELDMDKDLKPVSVGAQKDGDITFVGVKSMPGICFSSLQWKTNTLSIISSFSLVLPGLTCDSLASLLRNEMDSEVHGEILLNLCKSISRTACEHVPSVVNAMNDIIEDCRYCESSRYYMLTAIDLLLESLLSLKEHKNRGDMELLKESTKVKISAKELKSLASMVSTVAETGLLMWTTRVKLIDCICDFVLFDPHVAQPLTERLFPMLSDTDYRVRLKISKSFSVLFQTWNGHEELFQDVCCNFGVKLVTANKEKVVTAREVLEAGIQAEPFMETALVTLGQLALSSEKVEEEAVFMICAVAAINPSHRLLICAILDRLAKQINYATRFKYLEQLMRSILSRWIKAQLNLAALIEMRDLFIVKGEPQDFIQFCCPMLLPPLILKGNESDLNWIAMVASEPVAALVKHHFASIFAACLPLHCGNKKGDQEKAVAVLQGFILRVTTMSEDERDALIKKQMMAIVSSLIDLCHSGSEPQFPYFSKDTIVLAIQTVVDGFLETDQLASCSGIVDKINIFRPDRVFMFLLQIHYKIDSAIHPRHRCHMLARLRVLIEVIKHRTSIPSTCRYLFHIILQSLKFQQLQDQCCHLLSSLLDIYQTLPLKDISHVLGDQLKWMVPKLVACCVSSDISKSGDGGLNSSGCLLVLVHRLTVDADRSLYDYIRELDPFPDLECFERIRNFHQELCFGQTTANEFIKFVERISSLPQELRLRSMQRLHSKLQAREIIILKDGIDMDSHKYGEWPCDPGVVSAVWRLVELCDDDDDASDMRELAADFIARVGVGDPYAVVFHLPNDCKENVSCLLDGKNGTTYVSIDHNEGVCEELVRAIIKHLQQYILDDSVKIVDLSAKCLRGLLSTEKGQKALRSLGSVERSYIGVQTRGVDLKLVESLLIEIQSKLTDKVIPLEDACLWQTHGKTFEEWICTLVYSLIHHTDDIILRLCQDIVRVKAPLAELVFPHVLGNLAGRSDMSTHVCKLVSTQVKENIFTESNESLRSIQVVLDAMNEFRLRYVLERAKSTSESTKRRDTSKSPCLPSSSSSRSSRSSQKKQLDISTPIKSNVNTCYDWEKVYWLQIDYLLAAKAAIQCAAYFTSVLYVEHWCEEHFESLTLGEPDFSHNERLPAHVEVLMKATTKINEPDGIYGIRSQKLASQILTYEHEGNWSKAFENYDLVLRTTGKDLTAGKLSGSSLKHAHSGCTGQTLTFGNEFSDWNYHKGLIKSLQQTGCSHVLDLYCQGLAAKEDFLQQDLEFIELQYEAAWRAGKWDLYCISPELSSIQFSDQISRKKITFNANLHSCLRCLDEGDANTFQTKLKESKQALVSFISQTSRESTQHIHSVIVKLQILDQLSQAWGIRWRHINNHSGGHSGPKNTQLSGPFVPSTEQLNLLNADWQYILKQMQLHFTLLEPFVAFRRILFQILDFKQCIPEHLLEFATLSRKSGRFSQAAAAVHELKLICAKMENQKEFSTVCPLGRIEEAKLLRGQGQINMAINLTKYIISHYDIGDESADVYRLTGKWLAESQSSSSRNILEQYLKPAVEIAEVKHTINKQNWNDRQCRTHFQLAHYTDALFRSYEERLASSEWQTALRLRNHKAKELEALMKRFKSLTKGEKADYGGKIIELQKHVLMDTEEAKRLQDDKDSFLFLALESYQRCLVTGEKYDMRVVFRLVSLWFNFSSNQKVVDSMVNTIKKVQSYKFLPLVYQIASRMGSSKDSQGPHSFQFALVFIVKKMALDHPYHTIFQLLALANGDRIKDKQRSKSAFVIDLDKKHAAEDLLNDLSSHHQELIQQMRQMVEIYIKLAELETKKEDKKIDLPRDIRSVRRLDLVPVITATLPVDRSCQYPKESFPHFNGLCESVIVMNGINAPKVVECLGSDGCKYRQLAKSGNDDLRQDAVMEQFFGLVNSLLQDHSDTRKRHLKIRTYKVVPFTPSAGVLEWVDGTVPLGEYLIGSTRNGGAHGRYRKTDWPFLTCRDHMMMEKDKRKAFQNVCRNFRPVMHHFFLERFSRPADWFEKRLAYSRSVAASSMVGYIVGLGDRHSMNILIDQATAEVVHIDLGVAFEQGLTLKTPEQVPFRLTSDIVDGMGVTGVEGVFRRCCEETLSVMRTNKEALLTIIEVFIHDPLYKWALSPLKALQRQKESDDDYTSDVESPDDETEGNKDAARALMRVKQKLDGYEEGEMRSIQGQVQQLIQYSMDSERLCQMYPGWAAWL